MNSIAIVGLGLIGGSIAAGLKKRGFPGEISAYDQDSKSLETGQRNGLIDRALGSISETTDSDLTVLCVPVGAIRSVLKELPLGDGVVTDVASVKADVIAGFRDVYGEVPPRFVPGHPIAGSEQHGVTAADPDLFHGHRIILTPTPETEAQSTQTVSGLWELLGAEVTTMEVEHHDRILAQTSHLPHLLAFTVCPIT